MITDKLSEEPDKMQWEGEGGGGLEQILIRYRQ